MNYLHHIVLLIFIVIFIGCGKGENDDINDNNNNSNIDVNNNNNIINDNNDNNPINPYNFKTPTNITGKVIDGYIKNAKVCIDTNKNYICNSDEPTTITNNNGDFYFSNYFLQKNTAVPLISSGGINTVTNEKFDEVLYGYIHTSTVKKNITCIITPLTDIETRSNKGKDSFYMISFNQLDPTQNKESFSRIQQLQIFKNLIKSINPNITYELIKDTMMELNIKSRLRNIDFKKFLDKIEQKLSINISRNKRKFIEEQFNENKTVLDDFAFRSNIDALKINTIEQNLNLEIKKAYQKLENLNSNDYISIVKLNHLTQLLKQDKLNLNIPSNKNYDTPPQFPEFHTFKSSQINNSGSGTHTSDLLSGWSMVKNRYNNQPFTSMAPNADIILTYKQNRWFGYSPNGIFSDDLREQNISKIDKLNENDAFWVYFEKKDSIFMTGNNSNLKQIILKKGWNLVSISNHDNYIAPSQYFTKDDIESLWHYSNYDKKWFAFSPIESIKQDIKNDPNITWMDSFYGNDALWIKSKKDINISIENKAPFLIDKNTTYTIDEKEINGYKIDDKIEDKFILKALDANGDNIVITLSGADASYFEKNNTKRIIQFKNTYLIPDKTTFYLTITLDDGTSTINKDMTINIKLRQSHRYSGIYAQNIGYDNNEDVEKQWYLDKDYLNIHEVHKHYNGSSENSPIIQIVEGGFKTSHPDLIANVDYSMAYDSETMREGNCTDENSSHTTAVAGIIAARGYNGIGIKGIVPFGTITGHKFRTNQGRVFPDTLGIAWAYGPRANEIDISNNSWISCNKYTLDEQKYLKFGSENLRDKKGRIYVIAAGNFREAYMTCGLNNTNLNTILNSPYPIVVANIKKNHTISNSSTPGANIFISAFGTDIIWTTYGKYNLEYASFSGTSAAAPMVSGGIGLLLEACPNLTYRDVKYIIAKSAIKIDPSSNTWVTNSANIPYSTDYGFGKLNILGAINMCKDNYTMLGVQSKIIKIEDNINDTISNDGTPLLIDINIDQSKKVEWVAVYINAQIDYMNDYEVNLISPSNTKIQLLHGNHSKNRQNITYDESSLKDDANSVFRLSTIGMLDEDSYGTWRVEITDKNSSNNQSNRNIRGLKIEILGY